MDEHHFKQLASDPGIIYMLKPCLGFTYNKERTTYQNKIPFGCFTAGFADSCHYRAARLGRYPPLMKKMREFFIIQGSFNSGSYRVNAINKRCQGRIYPLYVFVIAYPGHQQQARVGIILQRFSQSRCTGRVMCSIQK